MNIILRKMKLKNIFQENVDKIEWDCLLENVNAIEFLEKSLNT
jgi:hypothetical protein